MKQLLALVVGVLVTACSGTPSRPVSTAATTPENGKWFCQMAPSGESWDCVQDPRLAERPQPTRLPEPAPAEPPPEPTLIPEDATLPLGEGEPQATPGPPTPPVEPPLPDEPSPTGAVETPARAAVPPAAAASDLPEYARLAYQPPQPVPLTELPGDFYAVQLIAMPSKETLEAFASRERLRSVSAVRVESNGELYFVLLLGIYESYAIARQAVAAIPPVEGAEPWIRPLGSLQAAMARADRMTGSSRY